MTKHHSYQHLSPDCLNALYRCVALGHLVTAPVDCGLYTYYDGHYHVLPSAVVFPRNTHEVQKIVKCCNDFVVSLMVKRRSSMLPSDTIFIQGGVVITLEKMNQIIDIDVANNCIRVQAGASLQIIQAHAQHHGFFCLPKRPNSTYSIIDDYYDYPATSISHVKSHTINEDILNLRAVLGTSEVIHTINYPHNIRGEYDFMHLLLCSANSLAIITEVVLKLVPTMGLTAAAYSQQFLQENNTAKQLSNDNCHRDSEKYVFDTSSIEPEFLALLTALKHQFDPKNILTAVKFFHLSRSKR